MLRWFINIFLAIVISLLVFGLLRVLLIGPIPLEVPILIMLFGGAMATMAWASGLTRLNGYQYRQHSTLILAYLEQAVRLNLPLPRMLLAAQGTERGMLSRKIAKLQEQLAAGASITDALQTAVPGTPVRSLGLLAAAERVGRVGAELNRLVREQQKPAEQSLSERSLTRAYPLLMTVVVVFVVSLLMIFVMPRFERILLDFKVPMPDITIAVVNLVHIFTDNGWVQLLVLLAVAAAIIQQVRLSVGSHRPMPWFPTSRQYADVCHVIANALDAGEPLDAAICATNRLAISASLRWKLRRWADGIEGGMPPAEAVANAGMPKLIVGLTGTSQITAAAQAFGFLSRYYTAKFNRWTTLLRAAIIPAMVFFFGFIVAAVALAMFLPLIAMIDGVSIYRGWL